MDRCCSLVFVANYRLRLRTPFWIMIAEQFSSTHCINDCKQSFELNSQHPTSRTRPTMLSSTIHRDPSPRVSFSFPTFPTRKKTNQFPHALFRNVTVQRLPDTSPPPPSHRWDFAGNRLDPVERFNAQHELHCCTTILHTQWAASYPFFFRITAYIYVWYTLPTYSEEKEATFSLLGCVQVCSLVCMLLCAGAAPCSSSNPKHTLLIALNELIAVLFVSRIDLSLIK